MYIAPKQKHTDLKPFKNQLFRKLGGGQEEIFSLWPWTHWIHFKGMLKVFRLQGQHLGTLKGRDSGQSLSPKGI
jgi:hypothetical protein